jgi:tetratricopeptide (TPR) repeat protein
MKRYLLLFILFSSSFVYSQETPTPVVDSFPITFNYHRDFRKLKTMTEDRKNDYFFQKLLVRFLDHDSTLTYPEMLVLMIGFTDHTNYKPVENMELEKEIIELNDNGYFEDAIEECKKYLRKNPLSLSANKELSYAYHKLGKDDSAKYFMYRNDMIMEAMIFSGGKKGRTPETAFFSLGLVDGDYFIPNVGLTPTNKRLTKDKNRYTIYEVESMNIENARTYYFFNIHHAKLKADNDGVVERKSNKLDKARKKRAAAKKGKKGETPQPETEQEKEEELFDNDNLNNFEPKAVNPPSGEEAKPEGEAIQTEVEEVKVEENSSSETNETNDGKSATDEEENTSTDKKSKKKKKSKW